MPKNKKGNARRAKGFGQVVKRELIFKESEQEYGQVLKLLGNCRLSVYCFDGVNRLCTIRGKMRNRGRRIQKDDIVLVSLRDFQDGKADVIHLYNQDESRLLKKYGELPESANVNESQTTAEAEELPFEFLDGDDDEGIESQPTVMDLPPEEEEDSDEEIDIDDL